MAKERLFELPETKGVYQLKGLVTGTEKDTFYKESKTKTNKDMRKVNFGVTVEESKTMYVTLQGMPKDNVNFSKHVKKGENGEIVSVPWAQRHTFNREGFSILGLNVGLSKTVDAKGNQVNDKKKLVEFDACNEINNNLKGKDGTSVFVKGKLEYSCFKTDQGELKKSTKLVPNQISLCGDVNFSDEKFVPVHDFTQTIVFMGIDQEKVDDKSTGRFIVEAKIITYQTIEDAEFVITDSKLAQLFKKNLKPYTAIEVSGKLDATTETEAVSDDCWGEENAMTKINAPTKRGLIITGAKPTSIDVNTYKKELVEAAIVKINNANKANDDFGGKADDGWGSSTDLSSSDEDEAWS